MRENQRINLVSRRAGEEELRMHVADALAAKDLLDLEEMEVVDVGSGAGFPGLVLAMAFPRCRMTLVEADHKKSDFLARMVTELTLSHVTVVCERVEVLGRDPSYRERFDVALARAVAELRVLVEYALPLVKLGGCLLAWKGRNYVNEEMAARVALQETGGEVERIYGYELARLPRYLMLIRKVRPTPARYPRRPGIPAKRPL